MEHALSGQKLSDPALDVARSPPHGQLTPDSRYQWNNTEKQALIVLVDDYRYGKVDDGTVAVFNTFVHTTRPSAKGLSKGKILAQYYQVKRDTSNGQKLQGRAGPLAPALDEDEIRSQLGAIILKLGLPLKRIESDISMELENSLISTHKRGAAGSADYPIREEFPPGSSRPKRQCTMTSLQAYVQPPFSSLDGIPLTPPSSGHKDAISEAMALDLQTSPTLLTKRFQMPTLGSSRAHQSFPIESFYAKNVPSIAFRGWSAKSQIKGINGPEGFRAGAFMNDTRIPALPDSEELHRTATLHVGWRREFPSPWISVTTSPIRAMMKARSPKDGRWLAVINLRFLERKMNVFSPREMHLKPVKVDGTVITYQPGGEYLIYAQIPEAAIINVIPMEEILANRPTTPGDDDPFELEFIATAWRRVATRILIRKNGRLFLSYYAGYAVGQLCRLLLGDAVTQYAESLVEVIVKDWQFQTKKYENWQENQVFLEGIAINEKGAQIGADRGEIIDLTGDDGPVSTLLQQLEIAASDSEENDLDNNIIIKSESIDRAKSTLDEDRMDHIISQGPLTPDETIGMDLDEAQEIHHGGTDNCNDGNPPDRSSELCGAGTLSRQECNEEFVWTGM